MGGLSSEGVVADALGGWCCTWCESQAARRVKNKNLEKYCVEDLAEVSEKTFSAYDEDPHADEGRYPYYEHEISSHFPQQSQQFPDLQVCYHLRGVLSHM